MTIKTIIFTVHQDLEQATNISVKRSHIYELLAAALGFNTYAALNSQAILIQSNHTLSANTLNLDQIQQRSNELGYVDILPNHLSVIIHEQRLCALKFSDLIANLKGGNNLSENEWEHEDIDQTITLEVFHALEAAAEAGNQLANYSLALYFEKSVEDEDNGVGSDYWYQKMQLGQELKGVEKEWAQAYKQKLASEQKYQEYLRKAARLGSDLAQLDLAEKFGDPTLFEGNHRNIDADPMKVAELAKDLDRPNDHHKWLTIAAETGNVEAMRELIESYDSKNLTRCWTWVYISQLLDHDLTVDRYYGMHDDGSNYDDDVGGTLHVGGDGGVELPLLELAQDILARSDAENLFNRMRLPNQQI